MKSRLLPVLVLLSAFSSSIALASDRPPRGTSVEALRIARESRTRWSLGRLTVRQKAGRPARVRAELLLSGTVVATLRVDPRTGAFLSEGEHPERGADAPDLPRLRAAVERSLQYLKVGEWTWPTEHGRAWGVPLKFQGRVVGTIKVDVRNGPLPKRDDD